MIICMSFTPGQTGGEYRHKLDISEMPEHTHKSPTQQDDNATFEAYDWGDPMNLIDKRAVKGKKYWWSITEYQGGSNAHNNIQPYVVVCFWRRIK